MSAFIDSITYEVISEGGVWFDITADVIQKTDVEYGIVGSTPVDRLASLGRVTFYLRNDAGCIGGVTGYYSKDSPVSIGTPFRITIAYRGLTYVRFYGYINSVIPESGTVGTRRVKVTAVDWVYLASNYPVKNQSIAYNKRIDEVIPLVIGDMPTQPQNMELNRGTDVFPTVFDRIGSSTKALSVLAAE